MNRMNTEQVIERVCRRLFGEMSAAEAVQFDAERAADPSLERAYQQFVRMDRAFGDMPVLRPSAGFTASVLGKISPRVAPVRVAPVKEKASWLDWVVGLAPAAGIGVIAVIWGRELWDRAVLEMTHGAGWLDQTLGTNWFGGQPFALLAVLIPVVVLGVGYASLRDYWEAEA
ncbi:MAG: hypothetical protein IPG71_06095 [bacterium]|nr:hypothetical protein [bacterium]